MCWLGATTPIIAVTNIFRHGSGRKIVLGADVPRPNADLLVGPFFPADVTSPSKIVPIDDFRTHSSSRSEATPADLLAPVSLVVILHMHGCTPVGNRVLCAAGWVDIKFAYGSVWPPEKARILIYVMAYPINLYPSRFGKFECACLTFNYSCPSENAIPRGHAIRLHHFNDGSIVRRGFGRFPSTRKCGMDAVAPLSYQL